MATTNIEADIQNITGVGTADSQFIISGQKFVVSSVPKELMWAYATKKSDVSSSGYILTDGSNVGDNILEVTYDGSKIATEVPSSLAYDITDSASLHYISSNRYPKYFIKDGTLFIKPDPSGSSGTVSYVDFSNVDDDCDLRNAVIYHASAKEFTKLGLYTAPTVGGTADELTDMTALDAENTVDDYDGNAIEFDQWFATLAHFIEDEEDTELAQAQISKISSYIQAYGSELQKVNAKVSHYLQLADKYYQWSKIEIQQYVKNNSRMAGTQQAAQAVAQGQQGG